MEEMYRLSLVFATKLLIKALRAFGKNGSALPGLIIERLDATFLTDVLKQVEQKVVLVTGTNGKTTTTKMLVEALRGIGCVVVTNSTGSNMTRGLIAALLDRMTMAGKLHQADWFVFEMDEAYAPKLTKSIKPSVVVGLNVLRDQLDRYGELDKTAQLIAEAGNNAECFIYNNMDPLLNSSIQKLKHKGVQTISFGIAESLLPHIRNEQTLYGQKIVPNPSLSPADVVLENVEPAGDGQKLLITHANQQDELEIPVRGFHNAQNATAALTVIAKLLPGNVEAALKAISNMPVPFGRGERLHLKDKVITVALVKNPSGFTSNLETFVKQEGLEAVLFVVNDDFADGRDVSWLWDVSFKEYISQNTVLFTSGVRGYDMALRLKHDNLASTTTIPVLKAVEQLIKSKYKRITIIPTYTALFEVRNALSKYGKVPRIW